VVDRALELNPELGLGHAVKGEIQAEEDWNWAAAEKDYRRAIELSPSLFEAHHSYSHLLMALGRVDESLEQSRIAVALDPLNTAARLHMGWHYLTAGQLDQAIPEYQATLQLDPSYAAAYQQLSWAYLLAGRYDEAATAYRKASELGSLDTLAVSAVVAAKRGHSDESLQILSKLIDKSNREKRGYDVAAVFAQLGRRSDAFHWLDRALAIREPGITQLKLDPFFVPLRSDPRFAALLQRMGLPSRRGRRRRGTGAGGRRHWPRRDDLAPTRDGLAPRTAGTTIRDTRTSFSPPFRQSTQAATTTPGDTRVSATST
jgi:tetratricopeptide (TPR) repeat protein